jgi:hypothetical protein
MIEFEFFTYTDQQWDRIKVVVRDALGLDADQIEREITRTFANSSITGMQSLRERIELAVSWYHLRSASTRRSPRRAELIALRKDTETLRDSIIDALAVQVGTNYDDTAHLLLRPGVDGDMLTATRDYFWQLRRNLDRQIEQAGQRGDNARKTDRDQCWSALLAIWCELGGKATGKATAEFVKLTSRPVMSSAVPDISSITRWLERHRSTR